jgi:hypothetical protein
MLKKALRLFVIKTRFEAWAIIYALAVGAVTRGELYLVRYPGLGGWFLFACCTAAVFMAGAKILDATRGPSYRRSTLRRLVARARST